MSGTSGIRKPRKHQYTVKHVGALDEIRSRAAEKVKKEVARKLSGRFKYMSRKTLVQYMEAVDHENIYRRTKSVSFYEFAMRDLITQVMELSRELRDVRNKFHKQYRDRSLGAHPGGSEGEEGRRGRGRPPGGIKARRAPDYHDLAPAEQQPGSIDDRIQHRRRIVEGDVGTRNSGERGDDDGSGKIEIDRAIPVKGDDFGG